MERRSNCDKICQGENFLHHELIETCWNSKEKYSWQYFCSYVKCLCCIQIFITLIHSNDKPNNLLNCLAFKNRKKKKTSSEKKLKVSGHNQSMRKVLLLSLLVFLGNKIILLNQFPFSICFNAKLIEARKAFALFDN